MKKVEDEFHAVSLAKEFMTAGTSLNASVVSECRYLRKSLLQDMMDNATPSHPEYDIGLRVLEKWRDHYVVAFPITEIPDTCSTPSTHSVIVFEDTGECRLL